MSTVFEKLGGTEAVKAAVEVFYEKLMSDSDIAPFFEGVNMTRQKLMQVKFMSYVFGGAGKYEGKDLVQAHIHLIKEKGLNLTHFDKVAGHFMAALQQLSVPQALQDEAGAVLMSTRPLFDPAKYVEAPASA